VGNLFNFNPNVTGGVPSREEVAAIFATLSSELSIAAVEARLR
jgi:hypothetical protein